MHVAIGIPCLMRGGTEQQTLQLVKALVLSWNFKLINRVDAEQESNRHVVTVVCYFENDLDVVREFEAAGATVRVLGWKRSLPLWVFVPSLRQIFIGLQPSTIHIQYMAPGFLPVLVARLAGSRCVLATVHQPWTDVTHGRKAKVLLRTAALMCKRFICVSEAVERSWFGSSQLFSPADVGGITSCRSFARHVTIHNTVDIARVDQIVGSANKTDLREILGVGDCIIIGAVARLSREKGMDVLLEAFALLCKQLDQSGDANSDAVQNVGSKGKDSAASNWRLELVIIGDGQERVRLEEQAVALGLYSRDYRNRKLGDHHEVGCCRSSVVWLGRRTWEDAIKLMSVMDICVVPSRFEGFGLTAAEAMACGKPVVAADVGGLPEVVGRDNSCGRLYLADSVEGLSQNLRELVLSKPKREALGKSGRARVERLFGFERFTESIGGLYQEMAGD